MKKRVVSPVGALTLSGMTDGDVIETQAHNPKGGTPPIVLSPAGGPELPNRSPGSPAPRLRCGMRVSTSKAAWTSPPWAPMESPAKTISSRGGWS